jgi:hypothetical protein
MKYDVETGKNGEYIDNKMSAAVLRKLYKFMTKLSYD